MPKLKPPRDREMLLSMFAYPDTEIDDGTHDLTERLREAFRYN